MYGIHSLYRWVPLGLILGTLPVIFQWLISLRWKKIGPLDIRDVRPRRPLILTLTTRQILLPYSMGNIALLSAGINSTFWSCA